MQQGNPARPWSVTREYIHDLRNLFSVILSAQHLLEDSRDEEQQDMLIGAIGDAAVKGSQIAGELVTQPYRSPRVEQIDLNHFIRCLEPELTALAGRHVTLQFELCTDDLPVRLDVDSLEAVLLELVKNARAALTRPGRVRIRTHRLGNRAWLAVADNGCGMAHLPGHASARVRGTGSVRGCGLGRVDRFVRQEQCRIRIHSRLGIGTAVALTFPMPCELVAEPDETVTNPVRPELSWTPTVNVRKSDAQA